MGRMGFTSEGGKIVELSFPNVRIDGLYLLDRYVDRESFELVDGRGGKGVGYSKSPLRVSIIGRCGCRATGQARTLII